MRKRQGQSVELSLPLSVYLEFFCWYLFFSNLTALCCNLIHGVPKAAPSAISPLFLKYGKLFLEKHSYCLKLNALRHNLIHGVPKAAPSAISPLFLKYGKLFLEKHSYCLKLNALRHSLFLGVQEVTPSK
ncbi:hypothetical protein ACOYX0_02480 [Enterococcus thailandicus]|nr:hypothetical protein [Enterococcus thailandicus]